MYPKTNIQSTSASAKLFCVLMVAFSLFSLTTIFGQATAIGYAGVTIVESASAVSSPNTSFEIARATAFDQNNFSAMNAPSTNNLDLGEIKVNSSSAVSCNMVINPARLYDKNGNDLEVTLSARTADNLNGMCTRGSETVRLNGTAQVNGSQSAGFYSGSYTLVFAFN